MSYYEYEDFYGVPSEFEQQIDEFKNSLLSVVKEEYINDMNRLKKENEELQEVKRNFANIKREYDKKTRELETEKRNCMSIVRKERLSELMKDFEVILYRAYSTTEKLPKCNKCDGNRKIWFKSPSGKDICEICECDKGRTKYIPSEYICKEFKIDSRNKKLAVWYTEHREEDYDYYVYGSSNYVEDIYFDGKNFEDIDKYKIYFKSKEDCQKYCEWLNERGDKEYK